jgi:dienelactone hydrolase
LKTLWFFQEEYVTYSVGTIRQLAPVSLLVIGLSSVAGAETPPLWDKLSPGPYPVGYKTSWELDYSRRYNMVFDDKTSYAQGKAPRPILINVWYPAAKVGSATPMSHRDYLEIRSADPLLAKFSSKLAEFNRARIAKEVMDKPAQELSDREKVLLGEFLDTPTVCVRNAPPAEGKFPLVIYHSGHGSSFEDNSVLCEFLASHGFIVLGSAFQQPSGTSFGVDGGHTSARDMDFLVAFARQIPAADCNHIGVVGHSGGAHAALRFGALPNSAVDAIVSLDTTQDYHGLKDPGWEEMTTLVVRNRKNFKCPLVMAAAPHAFFELADTLQFCRRYYFTIKDMGHNDYISQGGISRERLYQLHRTDQKQTVQDRAQEKAALERVKAGYQALCLYILRFLEAELKQDAAAKTFLAKQYRETKLGDVEQHVEFVPEGRTGPDPYKEDSTQPPTPRQLRRLLREKGSDKTVGVLKRFRKQVPTAPIYEQIAELYLVCDLLDERRIPEAAAFRDYYAECGLDCTRLILESARAFQRSGATRLAATYYQRLLLLEPANREAAVKVRELSEEKKEP